MSPLSSGRVYFSFRGITIVKYLDAYTLRKFEILKPLFFRHYEEVTGVFYYGLVFRKSNLSENSLFKSTVLIIFTTGK